MTSIHLHELAAVAVAVIVWTTIAVLSVVEQEVPEVLSNGGFAALAYVFGTRAQTGIEHRNNRGGPPNAGTANSGHN